MKKYRVRYTFCTKRLHVTLKGEAKKYAEAWK